MTQRKVEYAYKEGLMSWESIVILNMNVLTAGPTGNMGLSVLKHSSPHLLPFLPHSHVRLNSMDLRYFHALIAILA